MPAIKEIFKTYKNSINTFIETGTLTGATVKIALDIGFKKIYSIELSKKWATYCQDKFRNNKKVHIIHGDSGKELGKILSKLDEQCMFWLDAHYSGGKTAKGSKISPLYEEIEAIGNHKIKNHVIIIDDIRCCVNLEKLEDGSFAFPGVELGEIVDKIMRINNKYKIIYEDNLLAHGRVISKDILVATVEEK